MKAKPVMELLEVDDEGNTYLADRVFEDVCFEDFVLRGPIGKTAVLSRICFENCRVSPGTCMIRKSAKLTEVVFANFQCGGALEISSEAVLDRVVIKGDERPKMLWIRPQMEDSGRGQHRDEPAIDWHLNLTDYHGEVSITGLPADKILLAPDRHVVISANLFSSVDWKSLGISPLSYWKLMAKKVAVDEVSEGVFSLPPKNGRNFARSMHELGVLRDRGLIL